MTAPTMAKHPVVEIMARGGLFFERYKAQNFVLRSAGTCLTVAVVISWL